MSDGSRFCHTGTTMAGDGTATSSCNIGDDFASTSTSTFVPNGATSSTSAAAAVATTNGTTNASAGADVSGASASASVVPGGGSSGAGAGGSFNTAVNGGTGSGANSTARSNGTITSVSRSKSFNASGTAEAIAIGLVNAFDLNNTGDLDQSSFGFGAHLGFLEQTPSRFVYGIEGGVTGWIASAKSTSQSSSFNDNGFVTSRGGGGGFAGNSVMPFASSSSSTASSYTQSVSVDTQFIGSLRGKFGYAFGDYFPYVTAGIAFARYKIRTKSQLNLSQSVVNPNNDPDNINTGITASSDKTFKETAFGGVVGGGISTFLFQNVVISAEGLFYFFNDEVDVSSGLVNSAGGDSITFGNVLEGRLKVSVPLQ